LSASIHGSGTTSSASTPISSSRTVSPPRVMITSAGASLALEIATAKSKPLHTGLSVTVG
jgi:hypothetical protein